MLFEAPVFKGCYLLFCFFLFFSLGEGDSGRGREIKREKSKRAQEI